MIIRDSYMCCNQENLTEMTANTGTMKLQITPFFDSANNWKEEHVHQSVEPTCYSNLRVDSPQLTEWMCCNTHVLFLWTQQLLEWGHLYQKFTSKTGDLITVLYLTKHITLYYGTF